MAPPDWRNPGDYVALARLDLAALAWEFLRRNPDYRDAVAGDPSPEACARWGLSFAVAPELAAAQAPLFWRAEIAPAHVLVLTRSSLGGVTAADLLPLCTAQATDAAATHLRLTEGLQVQVPAALDPRAPLAVETALDRDLAIRLSAAMALERLLAGRPPGRDPLSPLGRARAVQMLRALDGRAAGASYREVARHILRADPDAATWRTASVRDVAVRLCRSAARMMRGGYRRLLRRRR